MQVIEAGDFEIERRLESYARALLSPDPLAIARVRARVMREARLQADLPRVVVVGAPAARRIGRPVARRLSMAILAAAVWLGVAAGSIFAAQAGGPLYPARMWLEQATLPGEPAARAAAELTRLDARLADALAAAARGDTGAVQAALDAYGQIADEMIAAAVGNATLESIVAALDKHLVGLGEVASLLDDKGNATGAGAAEASISRAIEHNQDVIDRLESTKPAAGTGGEPGGTSGSGGGQPTDAGGDDPKATKTPKPMPEDTVKPTQDPTPNKPTAAPTAKATPEPTVKPTPRATTQPTPPQHTPRGNGDN